MSSSSPLVAYQHAIDHAGFQSDPAQWLAAQALHDCHQALQQKTPAQAVHGVLWGAGWPW